MKRTPALIAAAIVTALIACGMLLIGANAVLNTSTVPIQDSPAAAAAAVTATPGQQEGNASVADSAQVAQLQNLIEQYKQREATLQSQLSDNQSQLDQANQQVQQLQSVLQALQARGVIRISPDGQIFIMAGRGGDGD